MGLIVVNLDLGYVSLESLHNLTYKQNNNRDPKYAQAYGLRDLPCSRMRASRIKLAAGCELTAGAETFY